MPTQATNRGKPAGNPSACPVWQIRGFACRADKASHAQAALREEALVWVHVATGGGLGRLGALATRWTQEMCVAPYEEVIGRLFHWFSGCA